MKRNRDTSTVWRGIEARFFYDHWEEKVVVALVSESFDAQATTPFEIRPKASARAVAQILAPLPAQPGALPRLPEEVRALASAGSAILLFPTHPDEVESVAANWSAVLDGERWFGEARGEGHLFFVSFEVGDDPSAYARFLRPERALWQALHHFRPSAATDYHLKVVEEALELGEILRARFFEAGRRSYHVALQALCDTGARTMVFEKRDGMKSVDRDAGATSGPH